MSESLSLYWSRYCWLEHRFVLAVSQGGVCFVDSSADPVTPEAALAGWATRQHPRARLIYDEAATADPAGQLAAYFSGARTDFSVPLHYKGTRFQLEVWQQLTAIDYGRTVSYSGLAEAIGRPGAVRAVSRAVAANPLLVLVPCHRVIGKNGALTGYRGGLPLKTRLLELERQAARRT
ncbi:methylated-DNA--[protein]-cysteine S-methyltransferase [Paenibacillus sp. IB182496]|uniref:methylated-DNA--[protein]-cysteine S-methyltransferase n=1 Tax=Paenibacillus sabuli TaxID=2772509 RepID=A0A927GU27_9BACL|nr:methylated-DNA--[protein]-cysteine S-methyltransferase [Paenibacillus sabuli]MBD2847921.1 methylated-DNA--[protein]-cysteine S-methyltransferase [Paenibacillus sabuli]